MITWVSKEKVENTLVVHSSCGCIKDAEEKDLREAGYIPVQEYNIALVKIRKSEVRLAANEMDKLIKDGRIDINDIDSLIKEGLDKDVADYWKITYAKRESELKESARKNLKALIAFLDSECVYGPTDQACSNSIVLSSRQSSECIC